MVIEAVIEDIGLKQRIFADLEASCSPHATYVAAPDVVYLPQAAWTW
jgi:hypothetical protein